MNDNSPFALVPTHRSISRAFVTACLLTGSLRAAEQAVVNGIETLEDHPRRSCEQRLLYATVAAALQFEQIKSNAYMDDGIFGYLDPELEAVLNLPRKSRTSFVLSTLLLLPVVDCAELLGIDVTQVKRNSARAASLLASPRQSSVAYLGELNKIMLSTFAPLVP